MTHQCPIRICPRVLPDRLLMCGLHWRLVPKELQDAVYGAYAGGRGLGSMSLYLAQDAAIRAVHTRLGQGARQ
jgi:hypothetical protein